MLHETSAAQRGPHNFLDLLPLGLELFLHDRDPRERQLDDIAQVDEPPKAFVFRLHRKGHVDRSGVDGARSKRRQASRALAGDDDFDVFFRLETEVPHRDAGKVIDRPGDRIDADDFPFEIFGSFDVRSGDQNVQRPRGHADHRFDRNTGDRGANCRSPSEQIIDIPGDERLDGDRRLHLNFVCLQSLVFKESLANGDDRGKLKQPATRCADHDSLRGRSSINKWWYTPRKNRSQQENQQLRRSEIRSHDWTSTPSVHEVVFG